MGKSKADEKTVFVTGDVIFDCNIYQGSRETPNMKNSQGTMIVESPGGASLLYEIINAVAASSTHEFNVQSGIRIKSGTNIPLVHHSYALWGPSTKSEGSKERVWRMTKSIGYGGQNEKTFQPDLYKDESRSPYIIVIGDGDLGFRSISNQKAWPRSIIEGKDNALGWVVLKMAGPVAQGDLWRKLSDKFREKLVVLVSIDDIRREEAGINRGLSWERTAGELASELFDNALISELLKCRHLVINFSSEGALLISNNKGKTKCSLIYDPAHMEGEWGGKVQGRSLGYMACLTAGIVNQLAGPPSEVDMAKGIMSGLSAMRSLHTSGHGNIADTGRGFPFKEVVAAVIGSSTDFSIVDIPPHNTSNSPMKGWTIIEGNQGSRSASAPLYGTARRVALFGTRALNNIPYARFGKLFTVDRNEIESLRGIQRLINDYAANPRPSKPLSVAVFGPPGSGKSFVIKQIAKTVLGKDVAFLEFNLSQFSGPGDLTGAFHQIRDEVLKGLTPFVFWDEFDSKEYMWLQYLLAPMQDAAFREGQINHPIGKCVFVFAGGTSYTMENFGPLNNDKEGARRFKLLKGPDFVSRLNGYLNILGPNKRQIFDIKSGKWIDDKKTADICFPVRRALLMRSILGLGKDEVMDMDRGLLNAFLETEKYRHGSRSMETLLLLSKRKGSSCIRRSDLPPAEQMSIHVDYDKFMGLIKRDMSFKMNSEMLAPACHEHFRESAKKKKEKIDYDCEYAMLPDSIKASNIAAAARIPEVFSHAGLLVVSKGHPSGLPKKELKQLIEKNIEILAEAEHEGWMEQKYRDGWVCGSPVNKKEKIHDALIPYKKLSEENKEKDRDAVRNYPKIVEMAGFKIVRNR